MIQYLTDPLICINSAISLSILWITTHDVYVSNIRHVISSTSVRPTFTKITLKTVVLNPAFFIFILIHQDQHQTLVQLLLLLYQHLEEEYCQLLVMQS